MSVLNERKAVQVDRCGSLGSLVPLGRLRVPKAVGVLLLVLGFGIEFTAYGAIPDSLRPVVIGAVQWDAGPSYRVQGAQARNTAQGWQLTFGQSAVEVEATDGKEPWALTLGLARLGSKEALRTYPVIKRTVSGNKVSYDRGLIEEWYVNGPLGLEQGFTLKQPLGEELVLELTSSWPAQTEGRGVRLTQNGKALHYGELQAVDAQGKVLPSRMRVMDGRVRLEVAARKAVYPVTIDPLLSQETKLVASDGLTGDAFGIRVALSGDGNTALIGAPYTFPEPGCSFENAFTACGAAYFFVRSNGVWVEEHRISGSETTIAVGEALGSSVALSNDGKTALILASGANGCVGLPHGAAYVYKRAEDTWVREGMLTIFDCRAEYFESAALSANGNVALMGRRISGGRPGEVYTYARNAAGEWGPLPPFTHDEEGLDVGSPIVPSGGESSFGGIVTVSGDGGLALIGGNDSHTGPGPVYVFKRNGANWTELQKITPSNGVQFEEIALAADGNTALIGAPDSMQVYVLVRSGTQFSVGQILSGPVTDQLFGAAVSITAHGGRLLVGAPGVVQAWRCLCLSQVRRRLETHANANPPIL